MACKINIKKTLFAFALIFGFFAPKAFSENEKKQMVIPGGEPMGVILNCNGVLISKVEDVVDFSKESPAKKAGLKSGDVITAVEDEKVFSVKDFKDKLESIGKKTFKLTVERGGKSEEIFLNSENSEQNEKSFLGIWIKDAASGIGTVTYYDAQSKNFGMLGHGISTSETGELFPIFDGFVVKAQIVSVEKGKKGVPGELKGSFFDNGETEGKIKSNNAFGIFGKMCDDFCVKKMPVETAEKEEIKKGPATVLTTVSGSCPKEYSVEIVKINSFSKSGNQNMVIKITDERLKNISGGIVRGMSGSPIIQNGKLVGAITYVFVNDPAKGYGVFIENMLSAGEKTR